MKNILAIRSDSFESTSIFNNLSEKSYAGSTLNTFVSTTKSQGPAKLLIAGSGFFP
jgi:hypothetical protein